MTKRVMVDLSATLLHHGHINLINKANELGDVIVGLTTDEDIKRTKGYQPELSYEERKQIMLAINHVKEVVPSKWLIDDDYLIEHNIDLLLHGDDNVNDLPEEKLVIVPRTEGISSSEIRKRVINSLIEINTQNHNANDKVMESFLKTIKIYFKMD